MPGSTCRRGNRIPLLSQMVTQRESRRNHISAPFLPSSWLPFSPSSIPSGLLIWATHFWWMLLLFINVQKSCPSFSFSLPSWKLRLIFPVHSEDAHSKEVNASALLTHPGLGPCLPLQMYQTLPDLDKGCEWELVSACAYLVPSSPLGSC